MQFTQPSDQVDDLLTRYFIAYQSIRDISIPDAIDGAKALHYLVDGRPAPGELGFSFQHDEGATPKWYTLTGNGHRRVRQLKRQLNVF